MNNEVRLDRRTILRGAAVAMGLPMLDAMAPNSRSLFAAEAPKSPVRMACIFFPNGAIMPDWRPTGEGNDWQLSKTLAPLEPFKSKINVVRKLAHDNGRAHADGAGDRGIDDAPARLGYVFPSGDLDSANAVAAITADLATNVRDPEKRYRVIKASMEAGKSVFRNLSARESALFVQLTSLPGVFLVPLGLASKYPPYSTTISNVPGPREAMYWNGARMRGMYPVSIVAEGMAVNITLVTYDDQVDFGIIACRRSLPQVQRLIDYLEEALVELEEMVGLRTARRSRAGQAAAGNSSGSKAKVAAAKKTGAATPAAGKTASKAKTRRKAKRKVSATGKAKPKLSSGAAPARKSKAAAKARTGVKAKAKAKTRAKTKAKTRAKTRAPSTA